MKEKNRNAHSLSLKLLLCAVVVAGLVFGAILAQKKVDEPVTEVKADMKYVFLFIGDGMGYSHVKAASELSGEEIRFTQMDVHGVVDTDNVYGETTDSAAAATAIANGQRTRNGNIGVSKDGDQSYQTILERLKLKGWHTGVITTAPVNHATPAGFYAHKEDRDQYYEIGLESIQSGMVDYLAGGNFAQADAKENHLNDFAVAMGYTLLKKPSDVLNAPERRHLPIIVTVPGKYSGDYMEYELDKRRRDTNEDTTISLAELVEDGIRQLGMESKFFMVVESAMIDSACHNGDVGSALAEVGVLDEAVKVALEFAALHKDETLILVTSDHETGGLAAPAGSDISVYQNQLISWKRMENIIDELYEAGFDSEEALVRVKEYFNMGVEAVLPLTENEKAALSIAYDQGDSKLFVNTVMNYLREKSGLLLPTFNHTNQPVGLYAQGVGAETFGGWYNNTEIFEKLADLTD